MGTHNKNIAKRIKRLESIALMILEEAAMLGKELSGVAPDNSPQKRNAVDIGKQAVERRRRIRIQ